ncbi:MAG TPA: hypothetical protein PK765_07710 [bacterium]|nr:hypothetical protein [bacterium]
MHYDYREFRYEQIEAPIPLNSCEFSDPIFASRFCRANPQPATGFIPLIIEGRLPIVKNMDRLLTKKLQSKNISDFSDKYAFYKGVFCKLQTAAGKLDPDSKKATILYLMGEYIAKKYKILRTCDL